MSQLDISLLVKKMLFLSFRIKNFRSISDTGWVNFSSDQITALVGQNESGKTAILEALKITFSSGVADIDDVRHGDPYPEIWMSTQNTADEIDAALQKVSIEKCREPLRKFLSNHGGKIEWKFESDLDTDDVSKITTSYKVVKPNFDDAFRGDWLGAIAKGLVQLTASTGKAVSAPEISGLNAAVEFLPGEIETAVSEFTDGIFTSAPTFVLFQEGFGLLPDKVNITDNFLLSNVTGVTAARNFLIAAKINLKHLVSSDTRTRASILKKANKEITEDFLSFWSQTIGKSSSMQIECSIQQHPFGHEAAGKPYLEFLIYDGAIPLYAKQRSRGTRWFMSFFLQLRASQMKTQKQFFLLDEPGANLHEKAQEDVLSLMEKMSGGAGIIYSTHSPHLIRQESFHRLLAVERDLSTSGHPTRVIGAHALGGASSDTLSPIFTVMGANFSRQQVIKRTNNVILEELSSQYYLKAFWNLHGCGQEVNFLPATGASNVPNFVNLFLGWGLDFIVVVDDEPSGRAVFNALKRDIFLNDAKWASARMLKIKDCEGVEDLFHPEDYKKFVLGDSNLSFDKANSIWAKKHGAAKAIHGLKFLQAVQSGSIKTADLHEVTVKRSSELVIQIASMLANYGNGALQSES